MGYTTDFEGQFEVTPTLRDDHKQYLQQFAETRRMKRDPVIAGRIPDRIRQKVKLPVGEDGEYFVSGIGFMGQNKDESVIDQNLPPANQPSLWCQWTPSENGELIEWDGGEKFYNYIEWLQYIIDHFLKRWGYEINGVIYWYGEESLDLGYIEVCRNQIEVKEGTIFYE